MKNKTNNKLDLLYELVKTSFKLKYHDSILGFLWVLLKPFMQFLILYIVFSNLAGNSEIENFTIYLLLGLIIFSFFQESIITGIHSLLEKSHIILKVNFDKTLAIYSTLSLSFINLLINFVIIIVFILFNPIDITIYSFIYSIFNLLVLVIFVIGSTFILSILTVRIRDLQHLSQIAMQLLFYATPLFYQIEIVPEKYQKFIRINPLYIIIQSIREAVVYGRIEYVQEVLILGLISIAIFIVGYSYFKSQIRKIAEFF